VVLVLLRGEDLETISRRNGVTAATISGWRDVFLAGGEAGLKSRYKRGRSPKVFGDQWPAHIATQQEVEDRASRDDTLRDIPNAVKKLPRLAVLIF